MYLPSDDDPDNDGDKDWADVRESATCLPCPHVESRVTNKVDKFYDFFSFGSRATSTPNTFIPTANARSFPPPNAAKQDSSNGCAADILSSVPKRQVLDDNMRSAGPAISQMFRDRTNSHASLESAKTPSSPAAQGASPFTTRFAHLIPPLGTLSESSKPPLPVLDKATPAQWKPPEVCVTVY